MWCLHRFILLVLFIYLFIYLPTLRKGYDFTCICHSVHRGEGVQVDTAPGQTHTPPLAVTTQTDTYLPADGYCRGRYASYWNAFFSKKEFTLYVLLRYPLKTNINNKMSFLPNGNFH